MKDFDAKHLAIGYEEGSTGFVVLATLNNAEAHLTQMQFAEITATLMEAFTKNGIAETLVALELPMSPEYIETDGITHVGEEYSNLH